MLIYRKKVNAVRARAITTFSDQNNIIDIFMLKDIFVEIEKNS